MSCQKKIKASTPVINCWYGAYTRDTYCYNETTKKITIELNNDPPR